MAQPDLFEPKTRSVSDLTDEIKMLLEGNFLDLRVEGEVSNVSTSRSGHTYFTLKDDDAQLSCIIWRGVNRRLEIDLADGQQVICSGDIQVYPPQGRYQLIVRSVEQAGVGALQKAFLELKIKLKEEGLFDDDHKKSLPAFPQRIGVITSATGAAFHDITDTLQRRWPPTEVELHHASVQGINAAAQLVQAISWFSKKNSVDVLIIGRGGGSLEDLWPFNEEAVARALFACPVPTISAVGHEVDFSITDFVADARAATPTQAAVIAAPDMREILLKIDDLTRQLDRATIEQIQQMKQRVEKLAGSHALLNIKTGLASYREKVGNLEDRFTHRHQLALMRKKEQLATLSHKLQARNPQQALEQGYARIWQNDQWIHTSETFDPSDAFSIEWKDGQRQIASSA